MNETTLMVTFHTQRLKDSICREFWLNLNITAEENSSHVCLRSVKQEWQNVSALNYHSQLGIPDSPFFDFLSRGDFFAETAVFFFSTPFLACLLYTSAAADE